MLLRRLAPDPVLLIGLVACVALYANLRHDISPMNNYLGDDGKHFVELIKHFPHLMETKEVSSYVMLRVLPVWCVRNAMLALGLPLEGPEIVFFFQRINIGFVALSLAVFLATLRELRVSTPGRIVGLLLALGAFSVSKWPLFYPTILDTFALPLGAFYAYFYVRRSFVGLWVTFAVSAFSWPYLLQMIGIILLAFLPRQPALFSEGEGDADDREADARATGFTKLATVIVAIVVGLLIAYALRFREPERFDFVPYADAWDPFYRQRHFDPEWALYLVPFAAAFTLVSAIVPTYALLRGVRFRDVLAALRVEWLVGALAFSVLSARFIAEVSDVRSYTEPPLQKLIIQIALTLQRPMQAVVGHFAFFGGATAVVLLCIHDVARIARRIGLGYALALLFTFLLLLTSESRQESSVFFLILPAVVKAVDERGVRWPTVAYAGVMGIVASKLWIDARGADPHAFDTGLIFEFPLQYYFMHHGISMNRLTFGLHLGALGLAIAFGRICLARARRRAPA